MGCTSSNQTLETAQQQYGESQFDTCERNLCQIYQEECKMYSISKNPIVQRRAIKQLKTKKTLSKQVTAESNGSFF